jgi:hypothetical protein
MLYGLAAGHFWAMHLTRATLALVGGNRPLRGT